MGRLIIATAVLVLSAASAFAEGLSFTAHGHTLNFPLPIWSGLTPVPEDGLETFTDSNDSEALIEYVPKGETFEAWQHLYTARIRIQPGLTLDAYREATADGYSKICEPEATLFAMSGQDSATRFAPIAHVCGRHRPGLGLDDQGQLMLTVFRKTENGVAIVSQEWRGPSFDVADETSWPLTPDMLLGLADAVESEVSFTAAP